jgi:short-subunit dehydrogenase
MKTIAIIGAGEGLGFSLAQKFGSSGFQVALVARNKTKLDAMAEKLKSNGIEASAFPADITNSSQTADAFAAIKDKYGFVDVLEFSPLPGNLPPVSPLELTEESLDQQYNGLLLGALRSAKQVLPDMLERGEGALLFTTPLSSIYPVPPTASVGIIASALRTYARTLHIELKPKGIYVGHLSLGLFMKPGEETPSLVANAWYDMYLNKEKDEDVFPPGVTPETIAWPEWANFQS